MSISIKSTTTGKSGNWYQYIWDLTGWEGSYGDIFEEVHFTMPKTFYGSQKYGDMAGNPHITMVTKTGWTYHRYETSGKKYLEKNRLVKKGKTAYVSDVYPATTAETEVVKMVASFIGSQGRP